MKTKNVFVSYIVHLMIDFSGFIMSAIQAGVKFCSQFLQLTYLKLLNFHKINIKGKMIYININGRSSVYYE